MKKGPGSFCYIMSKEIRLIRDDMSKGLTPYGAMGMYNGNVVGGRDIQVSLSTSVNYTHSLNSSLVGQLSEELPTSHVF